jgi:hypothetical protein
VTVGEPSGRGIEFDDSGGVDVVDGGGGVLKVFGAYVAVEAVADREALECSANLFGVAAGPLVVDRVDEVGVEDAVADGWEDSGGVGAGRRLGYHRRHPRRRGRAVTPAPSPAAAPGRQAVPG